MTDSNAEIQHKEGAGRNEDANTLHALPAGDRLPLVLLSLLTLAVQLQVFLTAKPTTLSDTGCYYYPALDLLKGKWDEFYFRTPGYSLFIALARLICGGGPTINPDLNTVMAMQFALGTLIPFLLYSMMLPLARNRWIAAIAASAFLFDRFSVASQAVILTEFLSQFLLIASLAFFLASSRLKKWPTAPVAGALIFMLLMVRPTFQLLHVCVAGGAAAIEAIYTRLAPRFGRRMAWYLVVALSTQVLIWGWCWRNKSRYGHFSISMQAGATLLNHTGEILEKAPASYGPLRDIYIKTRDAGRMDPAADAALQATAKRYGIFSRFYLEFKKSTGSGNTNAFERSLPEIQKATGLPPWEIALKYGEMNRPLILHNLGWYIPRVFVSWHAMWIGSPGYLIEGTTAEAATRDARGPLGVVYRLLDKLYWNRTFCLLITPYALFGGSAILLWRRRRDMQSVLYLGIIAGAIFYNQTLTALAQFTEFGRYRLPVQPLIFSLLVCLVLLGARLIYRKLRR